MDERPNIEKILTSLNLFLQCIALVAAGIWALYKFNIFEQDQIYAKFNGKAELRMFDWSEEHDACIFDFIVTVENMGRKTIILDHIDYYVCELPDVELPEGEDMVQITGDCINESSKAKMDYDYIMRNDGKIYPGEQKTSVYSFIAKPRKWVYAVEAIGFDKNGERVFEGADWNFCKKPKDVCNQANSTDAKKRASD